MLCANVLSLVVGRAGFPAVLVARRWRDAGTSVSDVASAYQSVARYQLAQTAGLVPGEWPTDEAARRGSLDILKWLASNGCSCSVRTCARAASGGHLGVLKWLRANGCAWDADTCTAAASGGALEVLQWARANGCDWTDLTCEYAALHGHLELLKWARTNGCAWNAQIGPAAAWGGHSDVLEWLGQSLHSC